MSNLVLHIKDANGLKKTISRGSPLPIEISGLESGRIIAELEIFKRYARLALYALSGIGILQAVLIAVLIFVR